LKERPVALPRWRCAKGVDAALPMSKRGGGEGECERIE
jgi:hypothetical protein